MIARVMSDPPTMRLVVFTTWVAVAAWVTTPPARVATTRPRAVVGVPREHHHDVPQTTSAFSLMQPALARRRHYRSVGWPPVVRWLARWVTSLAASRRLWQARRSMLIWLRALNLAWRFGRVRSKRGSALVEARRMLAADLRETLVRLGPTFIKLGQLLSTRVDALPPEVIGELVSLQNQVPGFSPARALEIVRQELGQFPFATFDPEPLAAASLAQVHRATLQGSGDEVVVKVQRDGLREQFDVDCANIRFLAAIADFLDPQEEGVAANWREIAKSSQVVLYREIDFNVERESCERFRENFQAVPYVKIPRTYAEYSTAKVLTMEYVSGSKITEPPPSCDRTQLAARLTTSYLDQLCRHGLFHCDPHPGNVACDDGYPGGRIIYYDFGMMEAIEPNVKRGFVDLVYSLYANKPLLAVDALETMGVLKPQLDRFSIERLARVYVSTFAETVSADAPWDNQVDAREARARRRARRQKLGADLFTTQADRPFIVPPEFTFVFRALSTIDGIGKCLDRDFDLTKLSSPYLRELADLRDGSAVKTALLAASERLGWRPKDIAQIVRQPRTIGQIQTALTRIERGDLKLRVRTTECESVVERLEARQKLTSYALAAALLADFGTQPALRLSAVLLKKTALVAALLCAAKAAKAFLDLDKLERRKARFFDFQNSESQDDNKLY